MYAQLFTCLLGLAPFALEVSAAPAKCTPRPQQGKAIYIASNNVENVVVALPIGSDGLLSLGTATGTGGAGGNTVNAATNELNGPDALASQSVLTVSGNNVFVANPGSSTLTQFAIDPTDPTKLTLLGQPLALPGEFPNTVAASDKNKLVCVGFTGAKAGVACSAYSDKGLSAADDLRPFDLNQTTPPSGPLNTVSQVLFSEDENTLFALVKGDPTKNITGYIAAFPVEHPCDNSSGWGAWVGYQGVKSTPEGSGALFGSFVIPGTNDILTTDASFGAAVLAVDPDTDMVTTKAKDVIPDQKATCWAALSPVSNSAWVADVGIDRLLEVSLTDASVVSTVDLSANGEPGLIDLAAAGKFVYALSPGNGTTPAAVDVVDVLAKKQVQRLTLESLGLNKNAQGVAVLL